MITEEAALMYAPIVEKMLSGQKFDLSMAVSNEEDSVYGVSDSTIDQVVAVLPVKGVITKEDFCGEMGTKTRDQKLKEFDSDPSIGAVILDIDTPGGSAAYLQNISETIAGMSKPVIAYYSSMCASAGYYIASRADKIFASSKADTVGSIGTMIQLMGDNPNKEKESMYVVHTIYATKSTDKNKPYEEALKGKYDLMRSQVLDPHNEFFLESVKAGRPDVNESALTGKIFFTEEAIQLGLVDGIKSFEEVVQYAFDLIKNPNSEDMKLKQLFKTRNMNQKMEKVSAVLGREVKEGDQLSAEDLGKIEASMTSATTEDPAEETPALTQEEETPKATSTEEIARMISESVGEAVAKSVNPLSEQLSAITGRLDAIEGTPGASASEATPGAAQTAKEDKNVAAWEDPNSPGNAAVNNLLDQHGL